MTVRELNRDQLDELKWAYYYSDDYDPKIVGENDLPILFAADIPDEIIFAVYEGTHFVPDDFSSSKEDLITIILNPVQTKFGAISVETLMHPRAEEDRIKIYDSDGRYLDYFSLEELYDSACEMETTIEEEYAARLKAFREEDNFDTLVSLLTTDCVAKTDNPLELERELNIKVDDNDYINRIGKYYLLMRE